MAVIGPSGSGKSSLVFAGALPRLRQRPGWAMASMRPAAWARRWPPWPWRSAGPRPEMTETQRLPEVRDLERRWPRVAWPRWPTARESARTPSALLLIIDQFEELYGHDQTTAGEFIDLLVRPPMRSPSEQTAPGDGADAARRLPRSRAGASGLAAGPAGRRPAHRADASTAAPPGDRRPRGRARAASSPAWWSASSTTSSPSRATSRCWSSP